MNDKFEDFYGEVEQIRIHDDSEPQTKRKTEVAAVQAIVAPSLPKARSVDEYEQDQRAQGKEYCLRCGLFKYPHEFGDDPRNTERQGTQTICLQCDSERKSAKNQIVRTGGRAEGYRYQARQEKAKRRHRKK